VRNHPGANRTQCAPARRVRPVHVALVMLLIAGACSGNASAVGTGKLVTRPLTSDGTDAYVLSRQHDTLTVRAPATNQGIGTREVFWPDGQQARRDAESCVTIASQDGARDASGVTQEGVVLRLRADTTGRTRAVTVTKNVYGGWVWVFNATVWDSAATPTPFHEIGNRTMHVLYPRGAPLAALPWNLCARVAGNTLEFVVWAGSGRRPDYDDADHAASFQLPPGFDRAGNYGGYIGHLPPGHWMTFTGVSTNE